MAEASVTRSLPTTLRKSVVRASLRSETERKPFAPPRLGRVIDRMIALSGLTKQQAAAEMHYPDASAISRWVSEVEPPNLSRIWSAPLLRPWFLIACAEASGDSVEIETTVRVRRLA